MSAVSRDTSVRQPRLYAPASRVRTLSTLISLLGCSALACWQDSPFVDGSGGNGGDAGTTGAGAGGGAGDQGGDGGVGGEGQGGDGAGGFASARGEDGAAGGGGGAGGGAGSGGDPGTDAGDAAPEIDPSTTLKYGAAQAGRLIGAALRAAHLSEADYATTAAAELNFATPENEMKWDATEPARNVFDFSGGDTIVAFALQHGIAVKGHTLVWHSQLPSWVSAINDPTDLHDAMINHIVQVVSHFRGQVVAWDVVNEAWGDGGQALRNSIFYQYLGASFIDDAFIAAHAADPAARLYYNDYGAEGAGAKSDAIYGMVQGMIARGVPIDGVGLQMHTGPTDTSPSAAQVAVNMRRLGALGLDVLVSEMDVQICASDPIAQSTRYHDIVADCVAEPSCKAVTVWGLPDKYSWRNGQACAAPRPLLFDDNYVPKPAHAGVLDAFLGH